MTTAKERTQALIWAGEFLHELHSFIGVPEISQRVKDEARHILRHYPSKYEVQRIAEQTEEGSTVPLLSSELD
jgi:hypothetical protein